MGKGEELKIAQDLVSQKATNKNTRNFTVLSWRPEHIAMFCLFGAEYITWMRFKDYENE